MFDLEDPECRPALVLRKLWANLDAAIAAGDVRGEYFKKSLRVLAAGGDGTVAWVLGTIIQVTAPAMLAPLVASLGPAYQASCIAPQGGVLPLLSRYSLTIG